MSKIDSARARKHLERRLAPLRAMVMIPPSNGWLRAIREALGMTTRQLAKRMNVGASRIPAIEKAEISGATTLKTMRQAATAINCTFVYAFVPIKPLEDIVRDRAIQKARYDVARINHTMRLENQALSKSDLEAEQQREIAVRFSHRLVFIHPFANGNGRFSRLVGDLLAVQLGEPAFSWGRTSLVNAGDTRAEYIKALRAADNHAISALVLFARS